MERSDSCSKIRSRVRYIPVVFDKEDRREASSNCIDMICLIGQRLRKNKDLQQAISSLGISVCHSEDGENFTEEMPQECHPVFVCDEFSGCVFDSLWASSRRILGPPYIISCAENNLPLPSVTRPAYCRLMCGLNICFTGFKSRDELSALCWLVHSMGGSVKKDFGSKVTHLVAKSVSGPKYRVAVALGLPIMTSEWIHKCWERRNEISFLATNEEMSQYKQVPFYKCCLSFHGFVEEEQQRMEAIAASSGAVCVSTNHEACTHIVVASDSLSMSDCSPRIYVVKQEWFWESVTLAACADESLYVLNKELGGPAHGTRQKLKQRLAGSGDPRTLRKRRSADILLRDKEGSVLDYTTEVLSSLLDASVASLSSPAKRLKGEEILEGSEKQGRFQQTVCDKPMTKNEKQEIARRTIASELLQTERNYVNVLDTIITVFKEPLENSVTRASAIVPAEDIRAIFSSFPDILKIHASLMECLAQEIETWSPQTDIGNVILKHTDNLVKTYPRFVNFFEMTKEKIQQCERQYPRFHAFLKWNISKPECDRQSLNELMIAPVQRIPRLVLLLQEMLKHTPEGHQQKESLENAVRQLKTVVSHINEDKRRTESQMLLFEILRDVEGCPANLLSSQRSLVLKVDLSEVADTLVSRGEPVTMFLLSDSIEIAKRKASWMPSPMKLTSHKAYKHQEFIFLSHIKAVLDIKEPSGSSQLFGLVVRPPTELNEKAMMFRLPLPTIRDEATITKEHLLTTLQECINGTMCNSQQVCVIQPVNRQQLQQEVSTAPSTGKSEHHGTLTRAFRGAKHKAKKVHRALSHHITKSPKRDSTVSAESLALGIPTVEGSVSESASPTHGTGRPKKNALKLKFTQSLGRSTGTLI